MVIAKQMDIRSNIKKYFDIAFDGEVVVVPRKAGGQWFVASSASERVWGTANKGLSLLGMNGTVPEDEIVAVKGEGKRAAKLMSQNVLWAFAAGALYTGSWVKLIGTKGAEITWGIPFHSRPKALKGYYYYKPVSINYTRKPYQGRKGKTDNGFILVALTDWDAPMHINTVTETFFDDNDPHVNVYAIRRKNSTNRRR